MLFSSGNYPDRNFSASMKCEDNSLTVFITKDALGGVSAKELHLSVDSCLGEDFNETHYRVSSGFDQCGTIAEVKTLSFCYNIVFLTIQNLTKTGCLSGLGSMITITHIAKLCTFLLTIITIYRSSRSGVTS